MAGIDNNLSAKSYKYGGLVLLDFQKSKVVKLVLLMELMYRFSFSKDFINSLSVLSEVIRPYQRTLNKDKPS